MASDLISRDALVDKTEILYQHTKSGIIIPWSAVRVCAINNTPTVDAVEVVRCKDCANRGDFLECPLCVHDYNWSEEYQCMEHNFRDETEDDGFCHKGVRKDAVD